MDLETTSLPSSATPRSRELFAVARDLAAACPVELGAEILLAGSVARGFADAYSDIELNFWTPGQPSLAEAEAWLRSIGAQSIRPDKQPIDTGSYWIIFRFKDAWFEAGWQDNASIEKLVGEIVAGHVLEHGRVSAASMLRTGIVLRSDGLIGAFQKRLEIYPDAVQHALVESALEEWDTNPHWLAARRASVERGQLLALNERLLRDISAVLRITFALNRVWEPEWKWLRQLVDPLEIQPPRLLERIDEVLTSDDPEARVKASLELAGDTLLLLGSPYDPSAALAAVQACLAELGPGSKKRIQRRQRVQRKQ